MASLARLGDARFDVDNLLLTAEVAYTTAHTGKPAGLPAALWHINTHSSQLKQSQTANCSSTRQLRAAMSATSAGGSCLLAWKPRM